MADAFVSLVVSATLLAGGLTTAVAATAPSSIAFHAQPLQPPTARSPITTVFEFTRSFDTCDREHDMPIGPGTTKVLYAYQSTPIRSEGKEPLRQHDIRGTRNLNLLGAEIAIPLEPDAQPIDLALNRTKVARNGDSFVCRGFALPANKKEHIIRLDPIISRKNAELVHHMTMYECDTPLTESDLRFQGSCQKLPPGLNGCLYRKPFGAWAVGGGSFQLPSETGFPMGGSDGIKYVLLEVHYDNHRKLSGVLDSSGFRLWHTPSLRRFDAGVLHVGSQNSDILIPPRQKAFPVEGVCPSECLSTIPPTGIRVFASLLHAHKYGRAIWAKHIREGVEEPEIDRNDNYDFMFQEFVYLDHGGNVSVAANTTTASSRTAADGLRLLPNDSVRITCVYNTEARAEAVRGGEDAAQEMCVGYFPYYPRLPSLGACLSYNHTANDATAYCPPHPDTRFVDSPYRPLPESPVCVPSPLNSTRSHIARFVSSFLAPQPGLTGLALHAAPEANISVDSTSIGFNRSRYSHNAWLDEPTRRYKLWWSVDRLQHTISFAAEVATTGWIGFGLSRTGGMTPRSDLAIGWIAASLQASNTSGLTANDSAVVAANQTSRWLRTVHFSDRHSFAQAEPLIDTSHDYWDITAWQYPTPLTALAKDAANVARAAEADRDSDPNAPSGDSAVTVHVSTAGDSLMCTAASAAPLCWTLVVATAGALYFTA